MGSSESVGSFASAPLEVLIGLDVDANKLAEEIKEYASQYDLDPGN